MSWWKREPTPEEQALALAACRIRMQMENRGSGSPNEIDRAWARIIADSLELSGFALTRVERPPGGNREVVRPNGGSWEGMWKG